MRHGHAVLRALLHGPVGPSHQAVDGIVHRRLGKRELIRLSLEGVFPIGDAIGPGDEELPSSVVAHLVSREAIEPFEWAVREGPQAAPDFHDHGPPRSMSDLDLFTGRKYSH